MGADEAEVWRRYDAIEAELTGFVSERMLDLAALRPGHRVLDLATGRGEPALRAARRVGPHGSVLGIDRGAGVLAMAREAAAAEGLANLELREGDAAALEALPAGAFDAATVRWGLMYFDDPLRALTGVARALRPGGVFVAAVWAEPARVAWSTVPRSLLAKYAALPAFDPEAPGVFRYADPAVVARDFAAAGLAVAHAEELEVPVIAADTPAGVAEWARHLGFPRLVSGLSPAALAAWEDDVARAVATPWPDGRFGLGGVTRLIVGKSLTTPPRR